jgi:hypothetical protein
MQFQSFATSPTLKPALAPGALDQDATKTAEFLS